MDTGSNRAIIDLNVESIAEVKVLVSSYQAEYGRSSGLQITAVTKSGTNRFRGSVYDVERNSDWNANSQTNILNGDPEDGAAAARRGATRSAARREARRHQQAVLLLHAGVRAAHRRQRRDPVSRADRARAAGRLLAVDGQQRQPVSVHQEPGASRARARPRTRPAVSPMAACSGAFPASQLYQTGLNILKMWPLPNIANAPAGQPYNFEMTRPSESILSTQPAMRFDYQPLQKLRASFKYSGFSSASRRSKGSIPGWNDTRMVQPACLADRDRRPTTRWQPTLFLEGTFGHSLGLPGRLFRRRQRRRPAVLQCVPGRRQFEPEQHRSRRPAVHLSRGQRDRQRYFVYDLLNRSGSPMWDGTQRAAAAEFRVGQPHQQHQPELRAAEHRVPEPEHRLEHRRLDQPDEGVGEAHDQDRLLQPIQQQAAGAGRRGGRAEPELPAGHASAPTRATRRSASPTRRSAVSAPTRRARKASRANTSTTTSKATCRTTGA